MSRHLAEKLGLEPGDIARVEVLDGRRPTFESPVSALVQDYVGEAVYMRREVLNRALREGPMVSTAYVTIDDALYEEFFAAMKESPLFQSASLRDLTIKEITRQLEENNIVYTTIILLFAGSICFGVVYNSTRIALSERGRELASLRVLGFTRPEVSFVLLGEVGVLVLLALPVGCVIGYWNAWLLTFMAPADFMRMPLIVSTQSFVSAMLYTVGFAVFSGLIVRRRIDRLDLVAVLKTRE
jgi:putative ABC transport system permease protein